VVVKDGKHVFNAERWLIFVRYVEVIFVCQRAEDELFKHMSVKYKYVKGNMSAAYFTYFFTHKLIDFSPGLSSV
jgi:hypothetical protein